LVEKRLKKVVVFPVDESDFESAVVGELLGTGETGETSADDENFLWFGHAGSLTHFEGFGMGKSQLTESGDSDCVANGFSPVGDEEIHDLIVGLGREIGKMLRGEGNADAWSERNAFEKAVVKARAMTEALAMEVKGKSRD
jgi:hypothetical protein